MTRFFRPYFKDRAGLPFSARALSCTVLRNRFARVTRRATVEMVLSENMIRILYSLPFEVTVPSGQRDHEKLSFALAVTGMFSERPCRCGSRIPKLWCLLAPVIFELVAMIMLSLGPTVFQCSSYHVIRLKPRALVDTVTFSPWYEDLLVLTKRTCQTNARLLGFHRSSKSPVLRSYPTPFQFPTKHAASRYAKRSTDLKTRSWL